MTVKHIFILTICIVLPNGLYSNVTTTENTLSEKELFSKVMANAWNQTFEEFQPIITTYDGDIIIKIIVIGSAKEKKLFVNDYDRIGVNITADSIIEDEGNKEVIDYFAKVLGMSNHDIHIIFGSTDKMKTLKIAKGLATAEGITQKIIQKLVEQINFVT